MTFADHFSDAATRYAAYRPTYDPAMIAWIAEYAPGHSLAWDCGTGNGQAAVLLANHFDRVIATDPSEKQIASATQRERVTYALADEVAPFIADGSTDLVTVAQAIHWFNLDRFYAEVNRVLRPQGVIAVWSYGKPAVDPVIDVVINWFHDERVGPMWPSERHQVVGGYESLPFPFPELPNRSDPIAIRMPRVSFEGYVSTWSAVRQARLNEGTDPMPEFLERLKTVWPDDEERIVKWPVSMRIGRRI